MDDQNPTDNQSPEPAYQPLNQPNAPMEPMVEPDTIGSMPPLTVATEPATQPEPTQSFTQPSVDPVAVGTAPSVIPASTSALGPAFGSGEAEPVTTKKPGLKKGMLATVIAAAAVVVLGGGSAMAYTMYYQNEQKVVTDSIVAMMQAKSAEFTGSVSAKSGDETAPVDISVKLAGAGNGTAGQVEAKITAKMYGKTYNVTTSGVVNDANELYFKVANVKNLVNEFMVLLPAESHDAVDAIIAKIENKWIKVDTKSIEDVSKEASKTQTCMTDAVKKFQDDKAAKKQVGSLYRANKFIVIDEKLGSKDGSLGYVISDDRAVTKAFVLSLKDTTLYKDLHACDESFTIDEKMFDGEAAKSATDNVRIELWVSRWTHEVTKLSVVTNVKNSDMKVTTIFEPVFNTDVKIETPKDATTIEQLQKDIEVLMKDLGVGSAAAPKSDNLNYRS